MIKKAWLTTAEIVLLPETHQGITRKERWLSASAAAKLADELDKLEYVRHSRSVYVHRSTIDKWIRFLRG